MTDFTKADLLYKDYSDTAAVGDDPKKVKEDRDRFSRHESYEVVTLINSIKFSDSISPDALKRGRQIIEWMIHEHLPTNIQGREGVKNWIIENFGKFKQYYPR